VCVAAFTNALVRKHAECAQNHLAVLEQLSSCCRSEIIRPNNSSANLRIEMFMPRINVNNPYLLV
jgi:hypothetical protein